MTTLTAHASPTPGNRSRTTSVLAWVLAAAFASSLALPAPAPASGASVVADCAEDSKLDQRYTPADYKDALRNIPTDVDEYTDCRDVIRRAQLAQAGGGGSDGGGDRGGGTGSIGGTSSGGTGSGAGATGGNTGSPAGVGAGAGPEPGSGAGIDAFEALIDSASAEERAAVLNAAGSPGNVRVGGRDLRPDAMGDGDLGTLNALPTPFLVILLLLAVGTVAATLPTLRSVVRARRQPTA